MRIFYEYECSLCDKTTKTYDKRFAETWEIKSPLGTFKFYVCDNCINPSRTAWSNDWYKIQNLFQRFVLKFQDKEMVK